jgi:prevent-host-death family protein
MRINAKEDIRPVSDFRKDSSHFFEELKEKHTPIVLTQHGRSVAVLIDIDSYERMEYDLQFKSACLEGLKDIEQGRTTSHAQALAHVRDSLKQHRRR